MTLGPEEDVARPDVLLDPHADPAHDGHRHRGGRVRRTL